MKKYFLIFILFFGLKTFAQDAEMFFNKASNEFIFDNKQKAINTINLGLHFNPEDEKLTELKDKILENENQDKQKQNQQDKDNQQKEQQNKDQQSKENESKDGEDKNSGNQDKNSDSGKKDGQKNKEGENKDSEGKDGEKKDVEQKDGQSSGDEQNKGEEKEPTAGQQGNKGEKGEKMNVRLMSKQEAEALLKAVERQEQQTHKTVIKKKGKSTKKNKNQKDW